MNFLPANKITAVLAIALVGLLTPIVQGQPPPPAITNVDFPQIGTPDKMPAFAVHTVDLIIVWSWAYTTNGNKVWFDSVQWNKTQFRYSYGPLTNKLELDDTCKEGVGIMMNELMTNTDPNIDKDRGLYVYVDCRAYNGDPSFDTFYDYTNLHLVKNGDTYSPPDLSGFSVQLNDSIPLYIPNLQWARYEIGYAGNPNPFEIDDKLLNLTTDPIGTDGFLYLPTGYMTNSSSTNGAYWMKISALAKGGFYIWNGDGTQIPETPFRLVMNENQTNVNVTVNGGDSGRGFVLQSSADLTNWTNCSPTVFVPTNAPPHLVPKLFVYPFTNGARFFRTATTNVPPI